MGLRGVFAERDDAIAAALFIGTVAAIVHALPGGLPPSAPDTFDRMALFWVLLPLLSVLGAALYRFHLVWMRNEDREGLRMAIGLPRTFATFFFYGFGVLFGMVPIFVFAPLLMLWAKLRGLKEQPPPVWFRALAVPLLLLLGPIARYGSSRGGLPGGVQKAMDDNPRFFRGAMLLWLPVLIALALPLSSFLREASNPQAIGLSFVFGLWLGDYVLAALAMVRVHVLSPERPLLTGGELRGGLLSILFVGLIFWSEAVRSFDRLELVQAAWPAALLLGAAGALFAHLHDSLRSRRRGGGRLFFFGLLRLVFVFPLFALLLLLALLAMPLASVGRLLRGRRQAAKLRGDVPRDAPAPSDHKLLLAIPLQLLLSPSLQLGEPDAPMIELEGRRVLLLNVTRALILLVGASTVLILLSRRGQDIAPRETFALALGLGLIQTDLFLLRLGLDGTASSEAQRPAVLPAP